MEIEKKSKKLDAKKKKDAELAEAELQTNIQQNQDFALPSADDAEIESTIDFFPSIFF